MGMNKVVKLAVTSFVNLEAGKTARKVATLLVPQKYPSTTTLMVFIETSSVVRMGRLKLRTSRQGMMRSRGDQFSSSPCSRSSPMKR